MRLSWIWFQVQIARANYLLSCHFIISTSKFLDSLYRGTFVCCHFRRMHSFLIEFDKWQSWHSIRSKPNGRIFAQTLKCAHSAAIYFCVIPHSFDIFSWRNYMVISSDRSVNFMFRIEFRAMLSGWWWWCRHERASEGEINKRLTKKITENSRQTHCTYRKCEANSINMKMVWNQFIMCASVKWRLNKFGTWYNGNWAVGL